MKNSIFILTFFVFSLHLSGQNSGKGFNYQAVVRGSDGNIVPSKTVELRFSLLPGQEATQASWIETHSVTADALGTVCVTVGKGIKTGGVAATFADVNFAAVHYWLKVEIREGGDYRELCYSALASVPYAEVAGNALTVDAVNALIEEAVRNAIEEANAATNAAILQASAQIGSIMPFAGENTCKLPNGWVFCDGSPKPRVGEFAELFAVIGIAWGKADGVYLFHLPDLRGMFLRGVPGNDPDNPLPDKNKDEDVEKREELKPGGNEGNNVGSYQPDAIRNISGRTTFHTHCDADDGLFRLRRMTNEFTAGSGGLPYEHFSLYFDASEAEGVIVGSDNRPKNVYVNYIIKYK